MAMLNASENTTDIVTVSLTNKTSLYEETVSSLDLILFGKIFAGIDMCLAPFIIIGNILVLVAIYVEPKLQTISNAFIASLAVSDLLIGVLALPLYSLFYLKVGNLEHNKYACLLRTAVAMHACGQSLFSLLLIAVDRYLAVIFPVKYPNLMTINRAKFGITATWVYSTFSSLLPTMFWNIWSKAIPCDLYAILPKAYIISTIYLQIIFCLFFTTLIYVRIFYTTLSYHKRRRTACISAAAAYQRRQKQSFKTAKVMFFVLLLFILFWLPYMSSSSLKFIKSVSWELAEVIKSFFLCLSFSNSVVNPFVYMFWKKDFRVVFNKIFLSLFPCCKRCRTMIKSRSTVYPSVTHQSNLPLTGVSSTNH